MCGVQAQDSDDDDDVSPVARDLLPSFLIIYTSHTTVDLLLTMADSKSTAQMRLTQVKDILTSNKTALTIPFDPDSTIFPTRKELPEIPGAPPGAAWVWGENDYVRAPCISVPNRVSHTHDRWQLGRLNLLTPTRVKAAAAEIKTGEIVPTKYNHRQTYCPSIY